LSGGRVESSAGSLAIFRKLGDRSSQAVSLTNIGTALGGHRFQAVRDPSRFPVCPRCKELAGMLGIRG
jgi:hypothetical protein